MPYVEELLEDRIIWGEYLPKRLPPRNSGVMVKGIGCVFIGTVGECQLFILNNADKYEREYSRRNLTR